MASDDSTVGVEYSKGMKIAGGKGRRLSTSDRGLFQLQNFPTFLSTSESQITPLIRISNLILEDSCEYAKSFASDFSRALIDDFRASLIRPKQRPLGISGRVQRG